MDREGHEASVLIAQYLRNAAYICGDDRPSARERLNHHIGVTLHVTRQSDQVGCRHPDSDIVEGAAGQGVDIAGRIVGLNGAFDQRPVRSLADHIYMQARAKRMQRSRRFYEFAQTLFHVHAPYVNDGLCVAIDVQPSPRFKTLPRVED